MRVPLDIESLPGITKRTQSAKFCRGTKLFKSGSISIRQSLRPLNVEAVQGQVLCFKSWQTDVDGTLPNSTKGMRYVRLNSDLVCGMDPLVSLVISLAPSSSFIILNRLPIRGLVTKAKWSCCLQLHQVAARILATWLFQWV